MSIDLLGPASAPNSVTSEPAESRTFGATDTWFQDCPPGTTVGGTQVIASFFNLLLTLLRNAIRGMGVTPNNSNGNMLLNAIQLAPLSPVFGVDTGTAGAIVVTLSPVPPGATTITPNGGATYTVTHGDGSACVLNDYAVGEVREFRFDGTNFQIGKSVQIATDAAVATSLAASAHGYMPAMVNGTIVESHVGNAVTFTLKTLAGAVPSIADPVDFFFQTFTGGYVRRRVTSALSITAPSGATLGATTGFRVWILAVDTGTGVDLGVTNCVIANGVARLNEDQEITPIAISSGAMTAGVIYTVAGETNAAYRKIAYAEYNSGITAGTWNAPPDKLVLFGPGVPSPGDVVQGPIYATSTSTTNTTSATPVASPLTKSITPTSAANLIRATASGFLSNSVGANIIHAQLTRGTTPQFGNDPAANGGAMIPPLVGFDKPSTTSSTSYTVYYWGSGGTTTWNVNLGTTSLELEEIMG